ncbi:MAG: TMEM43 family protein [Reyranellales bacterium]
MATEEGPDEVTEVTQTSWLARIGQSFAGVIFGIVLIVGACILLFWNEGRAIKTARSLSEGAGVVVTVAADKVDPANDGKLVHVVGMLAVSGPALDNEFGMRSTGLRLIRRVEMFQWTEDHESETRKKLGGGEETVTKYKYERAWTDKPVDSAKFHEKSGHTNPQMTYRGRNVLAPQPKLGAFSVPARLLGDFGVQDLLPAGDDQAAALQKRVGKPVQAVDGVLYVGADPSQPAIGNFRVTFNQVALQTVSIVARQAGSAFEPYRTRAGGSVQLISAGEVAAADMFKEAEDNNRMWTWLIRAGGCVLMFIGFGLILGPIGVLADVIPILGDVVRAGTGLVGLLCTSVVAPVVIAIGWFAYRPIVAVVVLVLGAALAYGAIHLSRLRAAARKAPAAV